MSSEARYPRDGAASSPKGEHGARSSPPSPLRTWSALDRDQRLAAIAAIGLFATMLLPWYQQNAVISTAKAQPLVSRNLNAFAVFSFVEAAVLLVAISVLVLLYGRAEGRRFALPGGDGLVIFAAGIWTALLLVLRLFDKPGIAHNGVAANVGVQWGIFFALAAAGLLAYAGSRMRVARRPEPPLLRGELQGDHRARRSRRSADVGADTRPGETVDVSAQGPSEDPTILVQRHPDTTEKTEIVTRAGYAEAPARPVGPATPAPARPRPRLPPSPDKPSRSPSPTGGEQLSFEDDSSPHE